MYSRFNSEAIAAPQAVVINSGNVTSDVVVLAFVVGPNPGILSMYSTSQSLFWFLLPLGLPLHLYLHPDLLFLRHFFRKGWKSSQNTCWV